MMFSGSSSARATVGLTTKLAVEQSDAHASNRVIERDLGNVKRRGSGRHSDHVRIVFAIRRKHHGDDLRFRCASPREKAAAADGRSGAT